MDQYLAEALYMDTNLVAKNLGRFPTLGEAQKACERHATTPLAFRTRTSNISKAQGEKYWYQITSQGTKT